jgi:F-box/WD-40 domain protein MET30
MKTFECIRVIEGHSDGVVCVNFDDKILASGSADGTIRIWNVGAGKCFVIRAHNDWVNKVAIFEKTKLFSCSDDHTIKLWNLETKELIRSFCGHSDQVQTLQISVPHRRDPRASKESQGVEPRLVTGSLDKTVKVWRIETGECIKTLFGHEEGIWCVTSDTLRIVSGAHDRKMHVWDMESGESLYTISEENNGAINCCHLSDTKIVSGNEDGTIHVYDFLASISKSPK